MRLYTATGFFALGKCINAAAPTLSAIRESPICRLLCGLIARSSKSGNSILIASFCRGLFNSFHGLLIKSANMSGSKYGVDKFIPFVRQ